MLFVMLLMLRGNCNLTFMITVFSWHVTWHILIYTWLLSRHSYSPENHKINSRTEISNSFEMSLIILAFVLLSLLCIYMKIHSIQASLFKLCFQTCQLWSTKCSSMSCYPCVRQRMQSLISCHVTSQWATLSPCVSRHFEPWQLAITSSHAERRYSQCCTRPLNSQIQNCRRLALSAWRSLFRASRLTWRWWALRTWNRNNDWILSHVAESSCVYVEVKSGRSNIWGPEVAKVSPTVTPRSSCCVSSELILAVSYWTVICQSFWHICNEKLPELTI